MKHGGGKKWTPAITVPQIRSLTAMLLRQVLDHQHPDWELRAIKRRAIRKEQAYADHHITRNLLPALRKERRR